ncbi:hypothetical protein MNBD_GAMMA24-547 [hydrothermal vent metagenome]|uniref:EF-hand domain-containing protein n=1 Tax=hydrothermal vent metagenome TaxID=652676 RepID=A0A3B1BEW6_9ZZZZ
MKLKKTALYTATALALSTFGYSAQAALVTDTLLAFDAGSDCPPDLVCILSVSGSYFTTDSDGDGVISAGEITWIAPGTDGGIIIGQTQAPGEIDVPWDYFSNTGAHMTTSPVTVVNDLDATKELDFTGWNMDWNGFLIPLGGDDANFAVDTGLATITCATSACANNESFILDYSAHIPLGDASGFGGIAYALHLEGTISAVPVPAAVWLFGSGLLGLLGVVKRKKVT